MCWAGVAGPTLMEKLTFMTVLWQSLRCGGSRDFSIHTCRNDGSTSGKVIGEVGDSRRLHVMKI